MSRMPQKILFADDDAPLFKTMLADKHDPLFPVHFASTPREVTHTVRQEDIAAVILDVDFRDEVDGFGLISQIKFYRPDCIVVFYTNNSDLSNMLRAKIAGCSEFSSKAKNSPQDVLRTAKSLLARKEEDNKLLLEAEAIIKDLGAVVSSRSMLDVYRKAAICRFATTMNVLIHGPTGCGKEFVAQGISRKKQCKPFITLNCATVPQNLIEDTFFGHIRGAYTGATSDKAGIFEEADGGDVFLDEIAELPHAAQASLLRVLETKEITRVGSNRTKKVSFRVIAATHADLEEKVRKGEFREDLLARLKGIFITVPALNERADEIVPIARRVLECSQFSQLKLSPDLEYLLTQVKWPQNVRQLKQTILSMAANARSGTLTIGDVPMELLDGDMLRRQIDVKADADEIVFRMRSDVSLEEAQKLLFNSLVDVKRAGLGEEATQSAIARSLKVTRSSLQRYLKAFSAT